MNDFLIKAAEIQADLDEWVDFLGLPIKAFEAAGLEGITQEINEGISFKDSTFADLIAVEAEHVPKFVIKALCLEAAYLRAALNDYADKGSAATWLLMAAAEQRYLCIGMAYGVLHEDSIKSAAHSINGKKGATLRHKEGAELKAWALAQAVGYRGANKDTAKRLVSQMPAHFIQTSKNPERFIYETLLAKGRPK